MKNFGFKIKILAKHAQLLSSDVETANQIIGLLYEKGCSSEQIMQNVRLLSKNINALKENWKFLEDKLKISPDKIRTSCINLLLYTQETIQNNWDNLLDLKLSPKNIRAHPNLLVRNPRVLRLKYKFLDFLGIKPEKINVHCNLLLSDLNILKDNFEFLRDLGILPEKIAKFPGLLNRSQETILNHLKFLEGLGLSSKKIKSQPLLLIRDPHTIERNYIYLTQILGINKTIIQSLLALLMEHPDAFAKKLRLLKSAIFGITRGASFDPNKFRDFILASPATLMAKKHYSNTNDIDYINHKYILSNPWDKIMILRNPNIKKEDARALGKSLVSPYKKKYDSWMKEYKKAAEKFYQKRGRRLIQKI